LGPVRVKRAGLCFVLGRPPIEHPSSALVFAAAAADTSGMTMTTVAVLPEQYTPVGPAEAHHIEIFLVVAVVVVAVVVVAAGHLVQWGMLALRARADHPTRSATAALSRTTTPWTPTDRRQP